MNKPNFVIFIASSKMRASLRHSVSNDKKKMIQSVKKYNEILRLLSSSPPELSESDYLSGIFPWSPLTGIIVCPPKYKFKITAACHYLAPHVCYITCSEYSTVSEQNILLVVKVGILFVKTYFRIIVSTRR